MEYADKLELYLSSCQVGITISSVALGVVAEPAITALFGQLFVAAGITESLHTGVSIIFSIAVINLFHVVVGEQVPTYLGVERAQLVSKYLAPVLYIWMRAMYPVVILSDKIAKFILGVFGVEITRSWTYDEDGPANITDVRKELSALLTGVPISEERKTEILNAVEIGKIPVADIMIDDDEIAEIKTTDTVEEIIEYTQTYPHTRYPVYEAESDAYIGLVYSAAILQNIRQLQSGQKTIQDIANDLPVIPPSMSVSKAIDTFQENKQELAIISTETTSIPASKAAVDGLITSTDALEQITGEMEDPLED